MGNDFLPATAGLCLRVRPPRDAHGLSVITLTGWDGRTRWSVQAPTADLFPMYPPGRFTREGACICFTQDAEIPVVQSEQEAFLTDVPLYVNPHPL